MDKITNSTVLERSNIAMWKRELIRKMSCAGQTKRGSAGDLQLIIMAGRIEGIWRRSRRDDIFFD